MKLPADIRAEWVAQLLSTASADRPRAEAAVRRLYAAAGFQEPLHFLWFESPRAASWVVAVIAARHHFLRAQKLSALSGNDRKELERAKTTLGECLGLAVVNEAVTAVGSPRCTHLQFPPNPAHHIATKFINERFSLSDDVASWFTPFSDADDLHRAEKHFASSNHGALRSALYCPTTDMIIGESFFADYPVSHMADDERLAGDRQPPLMHAAWEVARSAGLWWPFENAVILSDRPTELHLNDRKLLHRDDGPAAIFRDGWRVYAWNGKAVPEKWILNPEAVPPREYKGFDSTFGQWAKSKLGPVEKKKRRAKPASILKTELPRDPVARLEQLREHAGGRLTLFDRYQAGAHHEVWQELVALGASVRDDPHAADALAVAYETMRRVDANVRTLVERLTAMKYTFTNDPPGRNAPAGVSPPGTVRMDLDQLMRQLGGSPGAANSPQLSGLFNRMSKARDLLGSQAKANQNKRGTTPRAHVSPPADIHKRIVDFEKEFGTLPLSLRVFYEVVGEVNFIGTHPTLDPTDGTVATDPLVVYGLDEGIVEYNEDEDDDEGRPSAVAIAPDDLHKANTSGGDAYEVAIPDLRADGELLNERHNLFFVDYLRLCFRFGGFPGYDGAARVPAELSTLNAGLLEF